jgi:type IV pilus assembly protein PilN
MIKINLLPVRQIKKRIRARNELVVFFITLVCLCSGLVVFNFQLSATNERLALELKEAEDKRDSYIPELKRLEALQVKRNEVEKKIKVIKKLKKKSQLTVRIMDEVAAKIPAGRLWLKSFAQTETQLSIGGVALDNATIAQYIQSMTASPYFSNAKLASSALIKLGGVKLKSFSLTFVIDSGDSDESETPAE